MKNVFLCAAMVVLTCGFALGQAQEKVLWSFAGGPSDGAFGNSTLVADRAGNLYGSTVQGGPSNGGTIFELSPKDDGSWSETVLYSFCNIVSECPTGSNPNGVIIDLAGNLYGTTMFGGNSCSYAGDYSGCGVAFELSPPPLEGGTWTYAVLYAFCLIPGNGFCLDGALPLSPPTLDASGNLYGTAEGGLNDAGIVFELSQGAGTWTENVLYSFCSTGGNYCSDGGGVRFGVTFDSSGDLYGTTNAGGSPNTETGGALFKLTPDSGSWTESVIATFRRRKRTARPINGPVSIDSAGNLYTTFSSYDGRRLGNGAVGRLSSKGQIRAFFFDGADGTAPLTGVLIWNHRLYGTTWGQVFGSGNVFQIDESGHESVLYNFCQLAYCADGSEPAGGLLEDASGNLYGVTNSGGTNQLGVVFEITP